MKDKKIRILQTFLCARASTELKAYFEQIKQLPPDEIIRHSLESATKDYLLEALKKSVPQKPRKHESEVIMKDKKSRILQTFLCARASTELKAYLEKIKQLPPDEIIRHSFESATKDYLLEALKIECNSLPLSQLQALAKLQNPLDVLYRHYENHMDDPVIPVSLDCVREVGAKLAQKQMTKRRQGDGYER